MEPTLPAKFTIDGNTYRMAHTNYGRDQFIILGSLLLMVNLLYCLWEYMRLLHKHSNRRVIIMRGVPGSGKLHHINDYIKNNPEETVRCVSDYDFYYTDPDEFVYQHGREDEARAYCMTNFLNNLDEKPDTIFIYNTNAQRWEYENYITLARKHSYEVEIWTVPCNNIRELGYYQSRNQYGVPLSYARKIYERWEDDPCETFLETYHPPTYARKSVVSVEELDKQLSDYMSGIN